MIVTFAGLAACHQRGGARNPGLAHKAAARSTAVAVSNLPDDPATAGGVWALAALGMGQFLA
jgi:hypothetical protein